MEEDEAEYTISVTRDDSGYGFSITGVTTFSVSKVTENGAADRAGLKISDVIRRINGQLPRGSNKIVQKMITASSRVDLVISRKILRPVDSMNISSNGQLRMTNDSQVTDDYRTLTRKFDPCVQSSENQSKPTERSTKNSQASDTATRNIPESLSLMQTQTSVADETNLHSSKQTPSSPQDPVVTPSANLHTVASNSDLKSLAESSTAATRTDSDVLDSSTVRLAVTTASQAKNRDKIAQLALLSQLAQSDGDLEEQEPERCGAGETHYDQRVTHENCAAFGDLAKLRERPAHFGVVLNYALQNADSTPLLVAAVCDLYRLNSDGGSPKADRSPLHLPADEALVHSIECVIQSRTERDEPLKQLLQPVAAQSRELAVALLHDFVGVLGRGLGTLYGVQELFGCDSLSRPDELRLLEVRLDERTAKLLDDFNRRSDALAKFVSGPPPVAALAELQRIACLIHALLTVARLFALPIQLSALQTATDRFPPFCTKNKRLNLKRYAHKPATPYAHQFLLMQFASQSPRATPSLAPYPTCALCGLSLWTIGAQGFQCVACDVTVHCDCARFATEPCPFARAASLAPANPSATVASVAPTTFGTLPTQIGTLKEREKDAKRPRSVNVISALPNIIRKNLNLPGGATLGKEAKKHPTILQSNTPSVDDTASPTGLTSQLQSLSQSIVSPSAGPAGLNMSGLASPADGVPPPPLPATSPPPVSALSSYEKLDDSDQFSMIDSHGSPAQTGRLSSLDSSQLTSLSVDSDGTLGHKRSRSTLLSDPLQASQKFRTTNAGLRSEPDPDAAGPTEAKLLASCIDTELEVDNDKPLETLLGRELYASLKKRERERQQAIHELITTELSHVRWLIVLQRLFHAVWPPEFAELRDLLMPNVGDVLELHRKFAQALREARDARTQLVNTCGALLNTWFSQEHLAEWTTVPARFCSMHFLGIERLRKLRHKEAALDRALSAAEADPLCRRKQLTDLLACEMQRITKYTLLLERVLKPTAVLATDGDQAMAAEAECLRSAIESARIIAAAVNTYVRDRQNAHVLTELARRIDDRMSAADAYYHTTVGSVEKLARRRMLFEGTLKWHISKQRTIDVRCILLESVLLLLQVVDEKLVLKVHSAAPTVDRFVCSPIVPLQHVHVREDAADKRLFYVLNRDKGHSVMYDLVAPSHDERKKWIAHITEAAEAVKLQQSTTLGAQSGVKRKITLALRADTHSDGASLPGDRRSLTRTLTISTNDAQTLMPASGDADASNDREADAGVDADASPSQAASEGYQANQPVVVDVQEHDALGDGNFTQQRMTSLRATLRKHNVKGFDDTFLDTFAQPSAVGDAPSIIVTGDCTAPTGGAMSSDDDTLQHVRARALVRRRSSLSELDIHTCNAQCSLTSASVVEPIRELREPVSLCDAEVDSRPDDCANRSESDDEVADVNVPADTESESLPPAGPLSSPPDFIYERAESTLIDELVRPASGMSNRSVTPAAESDSTGADKPPAPVQQITNTDVPPNCTDVTQAAPEAVVDSDASTASRWTLPTSNANRQSKLSESDGEPGTLAVDSANPASSPSAPTRVVRSVSRNVRTEKHVLRVDEAECIAKQIAKHDRAILDGLNERQRLLTAFLTLQRNLLRATSLNAEAQRTRINSLQPISTSGNQQSLMQRLPEDQRSRAVAMRSLIENALKQAKSVLEFMTTYQPVTDTPKDTSSAKSDTATANGIGMYSAMPLGDALHIVDGVNQSLLELIALFEGAKSQIETPKQSESAYPQATEALASGDSISTPKLASSGSDNSPFVALSSRNVVLDKVSRMVSSPHEFQSKPIIVVEPKLAGAHDDVITDLPPSYYEAIARVSQSTNERREHLIVYERVRIISPAPSSSSVAVSKRQTDAVTHRQ